MSKVKQDTKMKTGLTKRSVMVFMAAVAFPQVHGADDFPDIQQNEQSVEKTLAKLARRMTNIKDTIDEDIIPELDDVKAKLKNATEEFVRLSRDASNDLSFHYRSPAMNANLLRRKELEVARDELEKKIETNEKKIREIEAESRLIRQRKELAVRTVWDSVNPWHDDCTSFGKNSSRAELPGYLQCLRSIVYDNNVSSEEYYSKIGGYFGRVPTPPPKYYGDSVKKEVDAKRTKISDGQDVYRELAKDWLCAGKTDTEDYGSQDWSDWHALQSLQEREIDDR